MRYKRGSVVSVSLLAVLGVIWVGVAGLTHRSATPAATVMTTPAGDPTMVAETFLRHLVAGEVVQTCFYVTESQQRLSQCIDSLNQRPDLDSFRELELIVSVDRVKREGGIALVDREDLDPQPPWPLALSLELSGGHWYVRSLNGTAIAR